MRSAFPQRSAEWFAARRGLPTCSRFDKIITPAQGKRSSAQDTLINELIAESLLPVEQDAVQHVSPEMEYGMRLEAEARCYYELEYAKTPVTDVGFILSDCKRFGGSPDALVGEEGGVEIKCPNPSTHIGYIRSGVLPNEYKCQLHGYLVLTRRKWWDFLSYCRNLPPFVVRVAPDEFTARLQAELADFCIRYSAERIRFNLP